ncbi:MAG: archease [Planctomycetes bacterium]|nr:archease [Planctomycetota bacterium]
MEGGFRAIDHTADAGIEAFGPSPEALFEQFFRGLISLLTDPRAIRPREERAVEVEGVDREDLLVRWLGEILYLVLVENWLPATARVEDLGEDRIRSALRGEPFDAARHAIKLEVKAATHHGLRIVEDGGVWSARVIFDL